MPVAVLSASCLSIPAAQQQRGQTELGFYFPIHRDERKQKPDVAICPEQQVFWTQGIPRPQRLGQCTHALQEMQRGNGLVFPFPVAASVAKDLPDPHQPPLPGPRCQTLVPVTGKKQMGRGGGRWARRGGTDGPSSQSPPCNQRRCPGHF